MSNQRKYKGRAEGKNQKRLTKPTMGLAEKSEKLNGRNENMIYIMEEGAIMAKTIAGPLQQC